MAEETKEKKQPSRFSKWFRELKGECRKIVWPSRQQTQNNTLVVFGCVLVVGVFIWILDAVFGLGINLLLTHFAV